MPLQQIIPTWLAINACDFPTPSGMVDLRTGEPVHAGGLNLGDYFDLTEAEAKTSSYEVNGILHSGRYRLVRVDPGATVANVQVGRIGTMVPTLVPNVNVVTSRDQGLLTTFPQLVLRPVVFLNPITPGNYGFIQELGIGSLFVANPGGGLGASAIVNLNGTVTGSTVNAGQAPDAIIGSFIETPVANQLAMVTLQGPVLQG